MHPPREANFLASSISLYHLRLSVTVVTDVFGSECVSVPSALITGLQLSVLIMHSFFGQSQQIMDKITICDFVGALAWALASFWCVEQANNHLKYSKFMLAPIYYFGEFPNVNT